MAYDANGARLGAAGHFASRLTAALITSGQVTKEQAADTFADLTADCLAVINGLEGVSTVEQALVNEMGATPVAPAPAAAPATAQPALRVIGQQGDVPAWLLADAAKAGVTAVYDNRSDLAENPKRPWFKQAEPKVANARDAKGFWPPR